MLLLRLLSREYLNPSLFYTRGRQESESGTERVGQKEAPKEKKLQLEIIRGRGASGICDVSSIGQWCYLSLLPDRFSLASEFSGRVSPGCAARTLLDSASTMSKAQSGWVG